MKSCLQCSKSIPSRFRDGEGKEHNLGSRKFCVECSPFGKHNTKSLLSRVKTADDRLCKECSVNQKYLKHSKCSTCISRDKRGSKRTRALSLLGSKCSKCGYSKCEAALEFHHLSPIYKIVA